MNVKPEDVRDRKTYIPAIFPTPAIRVPCSSTVHRSVFLKVQLEERTGTC